jgi:hypothetical protein
VKPVVPGKKKKMAGSTKAILVAGVVLLLGLAGIGAYVWISTRPPEVPTEPELPTRPEEPSVPEEPEQPEEPEEPTEPEEPETPFPTELSPGRDTDSDGLTDLEEVLYGTNARLPDTDADGFLDGNEVFHRYNPRGTAPGTLLESGLVKEYAAPSAYTTYYPAAWSPRAVADNALAIVLVAPSGETVTLSAESKDSTMTLSDWFNAANPGSSASDLLASTTKNGYPSLTAQDQLTAYLDLGPSVVTISYQITVKPTIDFLLTFQMMVNSVTAVSP